MQSSRIRTARRPSPADKGARLPRRVLRGLPPSPRHRVAPRRVGATRALQLNLLDLKFVLHAGAFVIQYIAGQRELVGPQVVIAHRLLKSRAPELVGHNGYALVTDAAADALDIPDEGAVQLLETYDNATVSAHVFALRWRAPGATSAAARSRGRDEAVHTRYTRSPRRDHREPETEASKQADARTRTVDPFITSTRMGSSYVRCVWDFGSAWRLAPQGRRPRFGASRQLAWPSRGPPDPRGPALHGLIR